MKKSILWCGLFLFGTTHAMNGDLESYHRLYKDPNYQEHKEGIRGYEDLMRITPHADFHNPFMSQGKIIGEDDSTSIQGELNCNQFIVAKEPFDLPFCPPKKSNSYNSNHPMYGHKAGKFMRTVARYVGLDKPIHYDISNLGTDPVANAKFNNYIRQYCGFTGRNNSFLKEVLYIRDYDQFSRHKFYEKDSTKTTHQALRIGFPPDGGLKCHKACDNYNDDAYKNKVTTETFECARGEGTYVRKYKYKLTVPSDLSGAFTPENGKIYIESNDCARLELTMLPLNGLLDENKCKSTPPEDLVKAITLYDEQGKIHQTTFYSNLPSYRSNIIESFPLINEIGSEGTDRTQFYQKMFAPENLAKLSSLKIVLSDSQINQAKTIQNNQVDRLLREINNFLNKDSSALISKINPITGKAFGSRAEVERWKETTRILAENFNKFERDLPLSVGFQQRSHLSGYMNVVENGKLNVNFLYPYGFVLQRSLNEMMCKQVEKFKLSDEYYIHGKAAVNPLGCLDDNGRAMLDNTGSTLAFGFRDYNWGLSAGYSDGIEILPTVLGADGVPSGDDLIPFLSYIMPDDNQPHKFWVHFIATYK